MITIEKKKRTTSNPKSKTKKTKLTEGSVQIKPRHCETSHEQMHPVSFPQKSKTQNSGSLNKSKPARKGSKSRKTPLQNQWKQQKQQRQKELSHSVSAERRHSLTKMNRTQANLAEQDIQRKISFLKRSLSRIDIPQTANINLLRQFYQQVKRQMQVTTQPLYSMCMYLHQLYISPLFLLFDMIEPYQELLSKKEQLTRAVAEQAAQNQKMQAIMNPMDIEIFRLKEKVEEQRQIIQRNKQKQDKIRIQKEKKEKEIKQQFINNKHSSQQHPPSKYFRIEKMQKMEKQQKQQKQYEAVKPEPDSMKCKTESAATVSGSIGLKGFKLDLEGISKNAPNMGFHDEFYSNIDQFSQSWRNQALKQKRF